MCIVVDLARLRTVRMNSDPRFCQNRAPTVVGSLVSTLHLAGAVSDSSKRMQVFFVFFSETVSGIATTTHISEKLWSVGVSF